MYTKKTFGLIGYPLGHSFSQQYFTEKFLNLGLKGWEYKTFEIENLNLLPNVLESNPYLAGFNVTSPYKEDILSYLDEVDSIAKEIHSVNCVKIVNHRLVGFNTDWIGFKQSLENQVNISSIHKAIILGTGGAAKAVGYALSCLGIEFKYISREKNNNSNLFLSYEELNALDFDSFELIVNATPCGMFSHPEIAAIDTKNITGQHTVFDLIYNPPQTPLLHQSLKQGARIINGLEMLHLQAEYSWKIWRESYE